MDNTQAPNSKVLAASKDEDNGEVTQSGLPPQHGGEPLNCATIFCSP